MSGKRVIITAGAPATDIDVQRLADVAAQSEDHVYDVLLTPQWAGSGFWGKQVFPLVPEPAIAPYVRPRMVYPGTITGGVDILPAFYVVGSPGDPSANASVVSVSASMLSLYSLPATAFPTTVTNGRVALVYAKVELVTTSAPRKFKSPTTGQVTTSDVALYSTPTVTIGVILGPTDGTMSVDDVPADTGDAWYLRLAFVVLGGVGTPWTQGTAITQAIISQAWDAGWIRRHRVQLAEAASVMSDAYSSGVNGRATTPLSNRWGASISVCAVMQHKVDGTGGYVVVDGAHDWRGRVITIKCGRVADNTNAAALPDDASIITRFGAASGSATAQIFAFTPQSVPGSTHQAIVGATWSPNSETISFFVNDTGQLEAEFQGTPTTAYYLFLIEASDQFKL